MAKGLVILGGGGHAKSCMDIIESFRDYSISLCGRIEIGTLVDDTRELEAWRWKFLAEEYDGFVLGVGQIHTPDLRVQIVKEIQAVNGKIVTLISPFARVSPRAVIQEGTVVMPGACINSGAVVGNYCIINTGAIVEHDAYVRDFCHIATGAVVNGDCRVSKRCFIGSNAVLLNQIKICPDTTVGAGSVVTKDIIEPGGIYVGNPAQLLRSKS